MASGWKAGFLALVGLSGGLACSSGIVSDEEATMMLVIESIRHEPIERPLVLSGFLYPEADSVPVPSAVVEWAEMVHGIPLLTQDQVARRDTTVAILTLYQPLNPREDEIQQIVDVFYFEAIGAYANDWVFSVKCERKALRARGCDVVRREGPGVSDFGPAAEPPSR